MPAGPLKLVLLGAPGVGKGTFAALLAKRLSIPHISTGDIIRGEVKANSDLGRKFKAHSDGGTLVPDSLVVETARKRLGQADARAGFILDGFPRTTVQAEALESFAAPSLCLNFEMPEKHVIKKLMGRRVCTECGANYNVVDILDAAAGYDMPALLPKPEDCQRCAGKPDLHQRADDKEDVIATRLVVHRKETEPLVGFYRRRGVLRTFAVKKGVADFPAVLELVEEACRPAPWRE